MTTNPANYWAYDKFVANPPEGYKLYQSSMIFNPNLPWDYIRKQLSMDEDYIRRFVYGEWSSDLLVKGSVFAREHINYLLTFIKQPIKNEEGCEIFIEPAPGMEYRMGVDPSEGVTDPSSISVIDMNGKKVAKFNGKLPIPAVADKVKFLYYKYRKPLIIPEANASGTALIREIRDLKVYRRKELNSKYDKETEKLGFRMSHDSKHQLINHFQALLRDKIPQIYDKKTLDEMRSFVWTNNASLQGAGAPPNFHDDDVISTMLAFWDFNPVKVEHIMARKVESVMPKRTFQYR